MRFYLTTPIYYINSTPHIGHAYTTIAADVLVRHHQQRGDETFFLTGTDEHASKVARVAEEQGLTPKEYADQIVEHWRALPERVNAHPDFFIRTTDEGHKAFVQDFLQRIYDNGDIYEDTYEGLYCVGCEAFKTEAELVDGKCPEHGVEPEYIREQNYFFRLSAYQDRLLELYDQRPDFVLPKFRANEARSFIEQGLQDFSISRAGQPWGVPLPWAPDQVTYVWVDALINYLSALSYAREGENLVEHFWPEVRHLLAKDILRFHCVFWPALLLSAGYPVPKQLFVHGYLTIDQQKISKSLGNVIEPLDLIDVYGADALRYYLFRAARFGQDGNASVEELHERYERELGNDLGNLLSRTTALIARSRGGKLVAPTESSGVIADAVDRNRPRRAGPARRVRPHRGARFDLGRRPWVEPACRANEAVGDRKGRVASGGARPSPVRAGRRPARGRRGHLVVSPRDVRADPRRAAAARRSLLGPRCARSCAVRRGYRGR